MNMFPLVYDFEKSFDVYWQTEKYISENKYDEKIAKLLLIYHNIGKIIPQTTTNYWTGHSTPYTESWDEMQIAFNLVSQGFYKQAFYTLRSSFELGLLSVYWNLNDDGHEVIQRWLKAEVDTPKFNEVWKKLETHKNFKKFQERINIKERMKKLGYLHDYIHSKGLQYSNTMGKFTSNCQTFENDCFEDWFKSFDEIVKVLCILHLVKYPIGTVKYDFRKKFGIDIPGFGGLDSGFVEYFKELLGDEIFKGLEEVAEIDDTAKNIMEWVESLPDMTESEQNKQIEDFEKRWIEQQGFEDWYANKKKIYYQLGIEGELEKKVMNLKKWAEENNCIATKSDEKENKEIAK